MATNNSRPQSGISSFGNYVGNVFQKRLDEISATTVTLKRYFNKINKFLFDPEIIFLDIDGTVLSWNSTYQKLQGYSEKEVLGQSVSLFYLPQDRQLHLPEKLIKEAQSQGQAKHTGTWVRKDGTTFLGRMVVRAIRSLTNNELLGFTEVLYVLEEGEVE